jgi:hypothetical protein
VQHTNTSSMSSGSTTSLFYRDLSARQLTTRSLQDISNGSTVGGFQDLLPKIEGDPEREPRFRIIRSEKGWECSGPPPKGRGDLTCWMLPCAWCLCSCTSGSLSSTFQTPDSDKSQTPNATFRSLNGVASAQTSLQIARRCSRQGEACSACMHHQVQR